MLKTEVRLFWTNEFLYLLFVCPYDTLNIFLPAQNDRPRLGLWDRDVVEMFLGADWDNIGHYREFEIAPTGDWIDLSIEMDLKTRRTKDEMIGGRVGAQRPGSTSNPTSGMPAPGYH